MAENTSERPSAAVFHAVLTIPRDLSFGHFRRWETGAREIDGLRLVRDGEELNIYVAVKDEYKDAPPGDHSFAQGFILAGALLRTQALLGSQLDWSHGKMRTNYFEPSKDPNSRFNITPEGKFIKLGPKKEED